MPVPPLDLVHEKKLAPPRPKFSIAEGASDAENENNIVYPSFPRRPHPGRHSRTLSNGTESPPITPRSITFNTPPISLNNPEAFYSTDYTPSGGPMNSNHAYPFPDTGTPRSGTISNSTSVADLSRVSSYFGYSRSGTSGTTSPRLREAFTSPRARPLTLYNSAQPSTVKIERDRPKSTMLTSSSTIEKPWADSRDPYDRIAYLLTYAVIFFGVALGAVRVWFGWNDIRLLPGNLCPVMDENFNSDVGLFGDNGKFFREVELSGYGNGQFEMTTDSNTNSYVKDGKLYITPTFTADSIGPDAILDGYVYNITGCTYNITKGITYTSSSTLPTNTSAFGVDQDFDLAAYRKACSAVSNSTSGDIINPIQSARLSTRKTASIRYGRVEVRAKIPTGDWLWPAIWMLPVDSTYGPWPMSGEIDIMEARGNGPSYPKQGTNFVRSSLNWGPISWLNAVSKTYGWWTLRRGGYDKDFHTYALEWDKDFMRIYVDTRLHHMLDLRIKKSFFELGDFPPVVQNGSEAVILQNPWSSGSKTAPFDQPFYLILNVAVGGTNGWFPDGKEKPWLDGSKTAMGDFWRAREKWLPTWPSDPEERSMVIDSIKMWQQC